MASCGCGAVAAKTYRARQDRFAPALCNQSAKRLAETARVPVPRRGAEQTHAENRAPMGIDAAGGRQHRQLCRDPDRAQSVHSGTRGACERQVSEERPQRVGAAVKQFGIHIADETRFRKGLYFEVQAQRRETAKLLRMVSERRL